MTPVLNPELEISALTRGRVSAALQMILISYCGSVGSETARSHPWLLIFTTNLIQPLIFNLKMEAEI
jgi:hypothetical protein